MTVHEIRSLHNPFRLANSYDDEVETAEFVFGGIREARRPHNVVAIREQELQAIMRGVERAATYTDNHGDPFYQLNKLIVIFGLVAVCLLVGGIVLHNLGMSTIYYSLPVALTFLYLLLIVVSEIRFHRKSIG